jgi:hypothetical protein
MKSVTIMINRTVNLYYILHSLLLHIVYLHIVIYLSDYKNVVSVHCGAGRDQTLVLFIKGFVLINPHIPLINYYFFSVANLFRTNPQTL